MAEHGSTTDVKPNEADPQTEIESKKKTEGGLETPATGRDGQRDPADVRDGGADLDAFVLDRYAEIRDQDTLELAQPYQTATGAEATSDLALGAGGGAADGDASMISAWEDAPHVGPSGGGSYHGFSLEGDSGGAFDAGPVNVPVSDGGRRELGEPEQDLAFRRAETLAYHDDLLNLGDEPSLDDEMTPVPRSDDALLAVRRLISDRGDEYDGVAPAIVAAAAMVTFPEGSEFDSLEIEAEPIDSADEELLREPGVPVSTMLEPEDNEPQRPVLDLLTLQEPIPSQGPSWLTNYSMFKSRSQGLARIGSWRKLAAMTGYAVMNAPYATGTTLAALLLDLATIYRDRLKDEPRATEAFAALADENPGNADALSYLGDVYARGGQWKELFQIYLNSVEHTWDPAERLQWTQTAADLAVEQLGDSELAIEAWERLWRLGDAAEEASQALMRFYHKAERWPDIARFLTERAGREEGAAQVVVLRELAEAYESGLDAPNEATDVLRKILELQPGDPLASLQLARVHARQRNTSALQQLAARSVGLEPRSGARREILRLTADTLWDTGELEQAVAAYDQLLQIDSSVTYAIERKREFLNRLDRHDELLTTLVSLAAATDDKREKVSLLARAADLADRQLDDPRRAIEIWKQLLDVNEKHAEAHSALVRLYDDLGDHEGVAAALDGLERATAEATARIDLLQRRGDLLSLKLDDDERAAECWKAMLRLNPLHEYAREQLLSLHRRREDYEAVNASLLRQIWLTSDPRRAEELSRRAARNLDSHFDDAQRSSEAWRRILDFAPLDPEALRALSGHYQTLGKIRARIVTLEQQAQAVSDPDERISLVLEIARLWESAGEPNAAAAAFERILRWDPLHDAALNNLIRIYGESGHKARALSALEHAAALIHDTERRVDLLRRCVALLDAEDHQGHFSVLWRVLGLKVDRSLLEEMTQVAEQDGSLYPDLVSIYQQLISETDHAAERSELVAQLATICGDKLRSNERAFLTRQSLLLSPADENALEALSQAASAAGRFEDLLAIIDQSTSAAFDIAQRKAALRRVAAICESDLDDAHRALLAYRRVLWLDPDDQAALEEMRRLAEKGGLWRQYQSVLLSLWDRRGDTEQRLDLLKRLQDVAADRLKDPALAFEILVQRLRLDPFDGDVRDALAVQADALNQWPWLIPQAEAAQLAFSESATPADVATIAGLYEEKLEHAELAFVLYARAFVSDPTLEDVRDKLETLGAQTKSWERLADAYRSAVANCEEAERGIEMLRRVTVLYEQNLALPDRAIDIHRMLLALKQDEMRSLEVVIDWHRRNAHWRDLRDKLYQWVFLSTEEESRVEKLTEAARLSLQLDEPQDALTAFTQILEIEPDNRFAKQGLADLEPQMTEPRERVDWLNTRLVTADEAEGTVIRLEMARLREKVIGDASGAIVILAQLVDETGPSGPGFEPLATLLRTQQRWPELVQLLQTRAMASADTSKRLADLKQAFAIAQSEMVVADDEVSEQLYRSLLEMEPDNEAARVCLARLLRTSGKFQELAELLEEGLLHQRPMERLATLGELGRLYAHNLGDAARAAAFFEEIGADGESEGAILALAYAARDSFDDYLVLRERQAELAPTAEAASILIHLAEQCHRFPQRSIKETGYYRRARALDAENEPAREALKAIGRRLKELPLSARLLPEEGDHADTAHQGSRLREMGAASLDDHREQAIVWFTRSVAVDPFDARNWEALSSASEQAGDIVGAYRAQRCAVEVAGFTTAVDPNTLRDEAAMLYDLALRAKAAGEAEHHRTLMQRAHELLPGHALSALAIAQIRLQMADHAGARRLLDHIVKEHGAELSDAQELTAFYYRGVAGAKLGDSNAALDDFNKALEIEPLHVDSLIAIGELLAGQGSVAAALEQLIRALTIVFDPRDRARLHHRIGSAFEDLLANSAEAGVHYEVALSLGAKAPDLIHRALRHFQRSGQVERSLLMLENLLGVAQDPDELAMLWLLRGQLVAAEPDQSELAKEAFDMALSYDPNMKAARDGLVEILERQEEWEQLIDVLEAVSDQGSIVHRVESLQRLATLSAEQLGDASRAAAYLTELVKLQPSRDAVERLAALYAEAGDGAGERGAVLALLVNYGPPYFDHIVEIAQAQLELNRGWAWALLSPVGTVSRLDKPLKDLVSEMRKEFAKSPLLCPAPEEINRLLHQNLQGPLHDVLLDLATHIEGNLQSSVAEFESLELSVINENYGTGRSFHAMAASLDLQGAELYRVKESERLVTVTMSGSSPAVLIPADVMNKLVKNQAAFLFGYALFQMLPSYRAFTALPPQRQQRLVPALWHVLGFHPAADGLTTEFAEDLSILIDDEVRDRWIELLSALRHEDPLGLNRQFWDGVENSARRAGLVACNNLQDAFRVLPRFDEEVPKLSVNTTMERLDSYIDSSPMLRDLVVFAAQPEFGDLLLTATVVEEG